jgi:hypothetical protein
MNFLWTFLAGAFVGAAAMALAYRAQLRRLTQHLEHSAEKLEEAKQTDQHSPEDHTR